MALVIECVDAKFILPKLSFIPYYDGSIPYINKIQKDEVLSDSEQIPAPYLSSKEEALSYIVPENLITDSLYKTNDSGHILKENPDWKLYFNVIWITPNGDEWTESFALVNSSGDVLRVDRGFSNSIDNIGLWGPRVCFLFESFDGNGYITYCTKNTYLSYGYGLTNSKISKDSQYPDVKQIWQLLFPNGEIEPGYPDDNSGTGGGFGDHDNTSYPIEIPSLPSISAASTGFISLFNPSLGQLNELASYLWSDLFEIDSWKKLFADPMDAILGLSILPVSIPSGGSREVKVGNIGTGISLTVASAQFVEVDCGSINVNEYWGAYLDYEPYTQAQIFLPYIGTRPISVDEIMGKTVRVVYHVDILTGACCCFIKCGESVLYTYNGQCSIPIPITGGNYTSVVNGVISIAASVGSLVATGGASSPTAIPAIASSAVNQMKPQIEKSGSISGSAGVLNMQTPYLILIRPRQALPSKQNEFIGYPSLITVQLTELTGYTEVQSIHLENIPATQEELAEIQSLLEGGVIF